MSAPPPRAVRVAAPAKVNLRLHILAREAGGHHALETVFCALALADDVLVRRAGPGVALAVEGDVDTGPPERNLARRAALAYHDALGEAPAVAIRLRKAIPSAAGMGGGSSDAAAVLRALDALHGAPLGRDALLQLAIGLGADVPFFLAGSALALAWGRGERLLPLPPLPARPVLVVHPGEAMPTAEAFAAVAAARGEAYRPVAARLDPAALASWEGVAAVAGNDFEAVVAPRIPLVPRALDALRAAGATVARLAGSGSSVFGVFPDARARDAAEPALRALGMRTWRTETATAEPAAQVDPPGAED